MQTFLPYQDFVQSAKTLDYRRLGKQRVEAFQLLMAIGNTWALACKGRSTPTGWLHHPAAVMWRGYDEALGLYMNTMIQEWIMRGYNNSMLFMPVSSRVHMPSWLGMEAFHASHRSNLLRKDKTFYGKYQWVEPADLPYVWPL